MVGPKRRERNLPPLNFSHIYVNERYGTFDSHWPLLNENDGHRKVALQQSAFDRNKHPIITEDSERTEDEVTDVSDQTRRISNASTRHKQHGVKSNMKCCKRSDNDQTRKFVKSGYSLMPSYCIIL